MRGVCVMPFSMWRTLLGQGCKGRVGAATHVWSMLADDGMLPLVSRSLQLPHFPIRLQKVPGSRQIIALGPI